MFLRAILKALMRALSGDVEVQGLRRMCRENITSLRFEVGDYKL